MANLDAEQKLAAELDRDELRLKQLGYRQEFKRELTTFTNYGISLSVVCVCSGLTALFKTGMASGGPVVMTWGWLVVAFFTMLVGLSMAEICSAFPTSGGLYFYAARLTPPKVKPFASWMTGWFNLLGQIAVSTGVIFGLALLILATASVASDESYVPVPRDVVLTHIAICVSVGVANSFGSKVISAIMWVSTWWQMLAPFIIIVTLFSKSPEKKSSSFVFTEFYNLTGIESNAWVVLIGLLMSQYTFTGYDSSAHVTEETRRAEVAGPLGIVLAIGVSAVTGFFFIIAFLFNIQGDYLDTFNSATGFPVAQILLDVCGKSGAIAILIILIVACWFAGLACIVANSRMIYAFARDGALPLSKIWHKIHPTFEIPLAANWLAVVLASALSLPYLANYTAFAAITSIATIGLYISYGIPVACKLIYPDLFHAGPFHLGPFSKVINVVSLIWIGLISIIFVLPTVSPIDALSMNYAVVLVGAVLFGAGLTFALYARAWFKGPVVNLTTEERKEVVVEGAEEGEVTFVEPPVSIEERHGGQHPEVLEKQHH
ncbi:hypothetical protein HDU96_004930 [Phlyctochytrium bullatum]|nr:hypothetical protein HDU96_004930 [Phlyctochytrium bullatum]